MVTFFLFFMIRLPRYYDSCPSFLTSLRPVFYPHPTSFSPLLCSKLSAFLAKVVVLWGAQLGQRGGVKMVGNTSKMMLRASKIDQGMAKIITQKIERILKKNHLCGFCKLDFATLDFCIGASKHPTSGEAL